MSTHDVVAKGHAFAFARAGRRPDTSLAGTLLLALCTLLLTRHAQVPELTAVLAPVVLATVIATLRLRPDSAVVLPLITYSAVSALAALVMGVEPADTLRFLAIVWGVTLATQSMPPRVHQGWVLAPIVAQAILIISVSVWLGLLQDDSAALDIRAIALSGEWGDVYSQNGWYYKVQFVGNALIPLAWMLALEQWRQGRAHWCWTALLSLGLAAAGNLTYILVCFVYAAWLQLKEAQRSLSRTLAVSLAIAGIVLGWATFGSDTLTEKFDGSDSSMGIRFDQIDVIREAFAEAPVAALFGHGIGARYPDGKERAYSQSQYIELQILYITYQIGLAGLLLLLGTLAVALHKRMKPAGSVIFWAYMACGSTNPYIFDSNQVTATLLLLALYGRPRYGN